MTKTVLSLLLSLAMIQIATAQQSIGFSDSTDFQYIIDYRLPDWGYSNFYIATGGLNYRGNSRKSDREMIQPIGTQFFDTEYKSYDIDLHISPAYQAYKESEKSIISLNTNVDLRAGIGRYKNQDDGSSTFDPQDITDRELKAKGRDVSITYNGYINSKNYIDYDLFILSGIDVSLGFSKSVNDVAETQESITVQDREENEFRRILNFDPKLGFGFGRLRNIAPQLRALRLKERYAVISNETFSNEEVIKAAEQFTRIQGYRRVYDRHEKYFWSDMNKILTQKLDAISAYDLFYLTDVLNENLGQRLEGFETSIFAEYRYRSRLDKLDTMNNTLRNFDKNKAILTSANIRWFKNLNLNHQLSFEAEELFAFSFDRETPIEYQFYSTANISWLWSLTDRYLLRTTIRNEYEKPFYKDRYPEYYRHENRTELISSLSYFIENKLSVTSSLSTALFFDKFENEDLKNDSQDLNWNFSVSLRYYFNRNLY